jgi:hypothetical protein
MDGRVETLRGRWRSLVAHLHDTQGVAGSSPARPTVLTGTLEVGIYAGHAERQSPQLGQLPFDDS